MSTHKRINYKCPYCGCENERNVLSETSDTREIEDCFTCGRAYILQYSVKAIVENPLTIEGEAEKPHMTETLLPSIRETESEDTKKGISDGK